MTPVSTSTDSTPAASPLPAHLLDLTSFLLVKLGKAATRCSCEALAGEGLRLQHFAVLSSLAEFGDATQRELSDRLGFDASDMVALLDDLSKSSYVERHRDEQDRRRHLVTITTTGRAALRRQTRHLTEQQDELLAPLNEKERTELHSLLGRLYEAVRAKN
jgi:MarR family transcriptional regulator, lower aerobic nicotinate degradation pathway regulator